MNLRRFWSRHRPPWQRQPEPPVDWDWTPLAGLCAHGIGMLDQSDQCCPPATKEER